MADDTARAEPTAPAPIIFGRVVIVGGGCYGSYYVRQLRRARERGAVRIRELIVVDRNAACAVAREAATDLRFVESAWAPFMQEFLATPADADDAIVPSPLMPHLFLHWLRDRAIDRYSASAVAIEAPSALEGVPWQRVGDDASRYVSFAEWMCPVNCIEPRICPHTRGLRDWDMSRTAAAAPNLDAVAVLHCTHRTYGVGMVDVRAIQDADAIVAGTVEGRAGAPAVRILVGTVSNCHGALGVLRVGGSPAALAG